MHVCSNAQTWTNQTFNMAPYAGQTVRIEFLVHQDGFGDDTGMYVDDVTLGGGACGTPSATPTSTATATATATATPTATASCTPNGSYNVLVVYADGVPTTLPAQLQAEPGIASVTLFDGLTGTPTLAQLQQYQIVI